MQRWDPFQDVAEDFLSLRDVMSRLFEQSIIPSRPMLETGRLAPTTQVRRAAVNLTEDQNNYRVEIALPGVHPENVDISVTNNVLNIRAQESQEQERTEQGYLVREFHRGAFERSVALPGPINSDQINAEFNNGILTVSIPKSEEARPKKIQVKAAKEIPAQAGKQQTQQQGQQQKAHPSGV